MLTETTQRLIPPSCGSVVGNEMVRIIWEGFAWLIMNIYLHKSSTKATNVHYPTDISSQLQAGDAVLSHGKSFVIALQTSNQHAQRSH